MNLFRCCPILCAALLAGCGQAGPLVLPEKNAPTPAPAAVPASAAPASSDVTPPATDTPAPAQPAKKEQP